MAFPREADGPVSLSARRELLSQARSRPASPPGMAWAPEPFQPACGCEQHPTAVSAPGLAAWEPLLTRLVRTLLFALSLGGGRKGSLQPPDEGLSPGPWMLRGRFLGQVLWTNIVSDIYSNHIYTHLKMLGAQTGPPVPEGMAPCGSQPWILAVMLGPHSPPRRVPASPRRAQD